MKSRLTYGSHFIVLFSVFLFILSSQGLWAQEDKKSRARINAQYVKVMDGDSYLDIKGTAKVDKKNVAVSGIEIKILNELEDGSLELGSITTNHEGKARFLFKDFTTVTPDSTNTYNLELNFRGNELYSKASGSISFRDAAISARIIQKDSINYMEARLSDPITDSAIVDLPLKIQVQRLFRPLIIGEEFNDTDDNGTILVPIVDEIPGVDGNLIFEVVLYESDDYGTVKRLVHSSTGIPVVDESTFDQRTMWSTRDKTPIFLLIFPNFLIAVTWGLIIYLIINLFRISNAKNKNNETI